MTYYRLTHYWRQSIRWGPPLPVTGQPASSFHSLMLPLHAKISYTLYETDCHFYQLGCAWSPYLHHIVLTTALWDLFEMFDCFGTSFAAVRRERKGNGAYMWQSTTATYLCQHIYTVIKTVLITVLNIHTTLPKSSYMFKKKLMTVCRNPREK